VETLGKQLTGLLDTGASVSVLGKGCRELLETLGVTVQPYFSVVIGRLELPVKYKGVSKPVTFYFCPYLEQTAYLGVDFWRAFGLAPAVVRKPVARGVKAAEEIHASQMEHYADQEDEGGTQILELPPSAAMHTCWGTFKAAVWKCITPKTSGCYLKEGQSQVYEHCDHICYTFRHAWAPR